MTTMLLLFALTGWAQEKLFDKYSDMKEVKSVYISKAMLSLDTDIIADDIYLGKVKNLNAVRVLSTMDSKVRKKMLEDIRALVKSSKYELLMKQKGLASSSEFYIARQKGKINIKELIMVMDGAATLKFICLEGNMTDKEVKMILLYQDRSSWEGIPAKGWENLHSLKGLDALKDLVSLEELKTYFDSDTWKQFEKQMRDLDEQMKDLNTQFVY